MLFVKESTGATRIDIDYSSEISELKEQVTQLNTNLSVIENIFYPQSNELPYFSYHLKNGTSADFILKENRTYLLTVNNEYAVGSSYIITTGYKASSCGVTRIGYNTSYFEVKPFNNKTVIISANGADGTVTMLCIGMFKPS